LATNWTTDLAQLSKIIPLADDAAFRSDFRQAKRIAKERFAQWLKEASGQIDS
jgi:starch phosphorylase